VLALAPGMRAHAALGRSQEAERGIEEVLSLGEGFGDLAFPMMAAAGTAVHLGLGDRAVVVGESAVARCDAMRADGAEARVTLALARCQVGEAEEALGLLLDVGLERPYPRAVHAVASSMVGDDRTAIADADAVLADSSSTYLDRILADVAAAAAAIRCGDEGDARQRLERARTTAADAGDVVASGLAWCATDTMLAATLLETTLPEATSAEGAVVDGGPLGGAAYERGLPDVGFGVADADEGTASRQATHPARSSEAFHIGPGWHRVIREMTGVEPHLDAATIG